MPTMPEDPNKANQPGHRSDDDSDGELVLVAVPGIDEEGGEPLPETTSEAIVGALCSGLRAVGVISQPDAYAAANDDPAAAGGEPPKEAMTSASADVDPSGPVATSVDGVSSDREPVAGADVTTNGSGAEVTPAAAVGADDALMHTRDGELGKFGNVLLTGLGTDKVSIVPDVGAPDAPPAYTAEASGGGESALNPMLALCTCPITREVMHQPVATKDGAFFEKNAIRRWFASGKTTNPITGQQLESEDLVPLDGALGGSIRALKGDDYMKVLPSKQLIEERVHELRSNSPGKKDGKKGEKKGKKGKTKFASGGGKVAGDDESPGHSLGTAPVLP